MRTIRARTHDRARNRHLGRPILLSFGRAKEIGHPTDGLRVPALLQCRAGPVVTHPLRRLRMRLRSSYICLLMLSACLGQVGDPPLRTASGTPTPVGTPSPGGPPVVAGGNGGGTTPTAGTPPNAGTWTGTGVAHFAAPDGSPSGDGTQANPWDIETALAQPPALQAGDTLFLRGGTYTPSGDVSTARSRAARMRPSSSARTEASARPSGRRCLFTVRTRTSGAWKSPTPRLGPAPPASADRSPTSARMTASI
jgi:hypothetical protein